MYDTIYKAFFFQKIPAHFHRFHIYEINHPQKFGNQGEKKYGEELLILLQINIYKFHIHKTEANRRHRVHPDSRRKNSWSQENF